MPKVDRLIQIQQDDIIRFEGYLVTLKRNGVKRGQTDFVRRNMMARQCIAILQAGSIS